MESSRWLSTWAGIAAGLAYWLAAAHVAHAQAPTIRPTTGRFMTLTSPITDEAIGSVRRTALALQADALREGGEGVLVLELTPGASQFHHVYALADFLASPAVSGLRTVAWIPETVTGHNVVVALMCDEIVVAEGTSLGDIGRGEALPAEQRAIVLELVGRGTNRLVTTALAAAMIDPQTELLQVAVEQNGARERRLATAEEARQLTATGASIPESRVLKERGLPGIFSAVEARHGGFLVAQVAASRSAVAEAYGLTPEALRESGQPAAVEQVSLIEIRDGIDTMLSSFLQRQIARSVEAGTQIIVFEIHSPGGHLEEVRDLSLAIARLSESDVRTIAWVPELATGESVLLALGCDEIYLTPETRFGAVGRRREFRVEDDDDPAAAAEREQTFLRETLTELARLKHRPAAILQAMADPDLLVYQATHRESGEVTFLSDEELDREAATWIRGPAVTEAGQGLLTVSGLRAQQLMVAEPPVESFDEVRHRLGLPDQLVAQRIGKTWVDSLVFALNRRSVTGLLFVTAIICIYLELHFMSGFLGLLATTCFALFFWSRHLGGTAGGLEVLLFLLGLGALALEIFVLPGFGVFGIVGGAMVLASLVMASQTFGNIESGRDWAQARETLKTISTAIVTVVLMAMALSRFLPRVPFLNEMILTPPGRGSVHESEPRLSPESLADAAGLMGASGVSETVLRPAGKARIGGRLLDVTSNGPYIPAGRAIEVVQASGRHIVVREV